MIEPTDEMIRAYEAAAAEEFNWIAVRGSRRGLAAVLAVVARDRCLAPAGHVHVEPSVEDWDWTPPKREWPPGRGGKHPHYCVSCSDGEKAGPGCGICRSTGFDQTPWPNCGRCAT